MSDLTIIVPSRGRPQNITRLIDGWADTALGEAKLWVVIDDDDPTVDEYRDACHDTEGWLTLIASERLGLAGSLNRWALEVDTFALGFLGDDHLPWTVGWDRDILLTLRDLGTGIAYGDDLLQHERIPTAVFMTSDIVFALGYMCPPEQRHMYLDDAWKAWGEGMGRLRYLPDVVIEHLHPVAGKAPHDERYAETDAFMGPDGKAWERYNTSGALAFDIAKLRGLL